ncbi:hypothetical protein BV25DRAFT_272670 [Artomyces pyxidatus]|uniref:Uncharacterized protein n=1 Tax=Artomyces pyxidatus TaxID=48021 RepID=A0ACB8T8M7_9AGAM|nr:hypothetical protein BV25DRAFT_272670 [Artomyces pyxidatus]
MLAVERTSKWRIRGVVERQSEARHFNTRSSNMGSGELQAANWTGRSRESCEVPSGSAHKCTYILNVVDRVSLFYELQCAGCTTQPANQPAITLIRRQDQPKRVSGASWARSPLRHSR